jgi:hypothetical protein
MSLSGQGKYGDAERIRREVLEPTIARNLEDVRARIRASPPTNAAAPAARQLPAGTRVLVQRLVAKPKHNGKRARVVSFDAHTGRYAVALDDGRDSLRSCR